MTDWITLAQARIAVGNEKLETVLEWYNQANPNNTRTDLNGAGNDVDAWRHGATGAELGKLDRMAGAMAGNGILGVAVDQAFSDLEDRVLEAYTQNVLDWLRVA